MIRKISIVIVWVFAAASIFVFAFSKNLPADIEGIILRYYIIMSISMFVFMIGGSVYNLRYIDKRERVRLLKRLIAVFGIVILANSILNSTYKIDGDSLFFAFSLGYGTSFMELIFMKAPKELEAKEEEFEEVELEEEELKEVDHKEN